MVRGKHIMGSLTRSLDLTEEPIPGLPLIEIAGDERVLIENHLGVTCYESGRIQVKVKRGSVIVCGCGLQFAKMTKSILVICGRIESVQLCRGCV